MITKTLSCDCCEKELFSSTHVYGIEETVREVKGRYFWRWLGKSESHIAIHIWPDCWSSIQEYIKEKKAEKSKDD